MVDFDVAFGFFGKKEFDVGTVDEFDHDLDVLVAFLDGFVDEDRFSIEHFVVEATVFSKVDIVAENDCFISEINVCSMKIFTEKWRSFNIVDLGESAQAIPSFI